MALVARAYPVRSREAVEEFARELRARPEETRRFYGSFNVRRETWFLQETAYGTFVIGVTDVSEPVDKVAAEYAASEEPFVAWFKQRVLDISGVDPNQTPLGPQSELVFDSAAV